MWLIRISINTIRKNIPAVCACISISAHCTHVYLLKDNLWSGRELSYPWHQRAEYGTRRRLRAFLHDYTLLELGRIVFLPSCIQWSDQWQTYNWVPLQFVILHSVEFLEYVLAQCLLCWDCIPCLNVAAELRRTLSTSSSWPYLY